MKDYIQSFDSFLNEQLFESVDFDLFKFLDDKKNVGILKTVFETNLDKVIDTKTLAGQENMYKGVIFLKKTEKDRGAGYTYYLEVAERPNFSWGSRRTIIIAASMEAFNAGNWEVPYPEKLLGRVMAKNASNANLGAEMKEYLQKLQKPYLEEAEGYYKRSYEIVKAFASQISSGQFRDWSAMVRAQWDACATIFKNANKDNIHWIDEVDSGPYAKYFKAIKDKGLALVGTSGLYYNTVKYSKMKLGAPLDSLSEILYCGTPHMGFRKSYYEDSNNRRRNSFNEAMESGNFKDKPEYYTAPTVFVRGNTAIYDSYLSPLAGHSIKLANYQSGMPGWTMTLDGYTMAHAFKGNTWYTLK